MQEIEIISPEYNEELNVESNKTKIIALIPLTRDPAGIVWEYVRPKVDIVNGVSGITKRVTVEFYQSVIIDFEINKYSMMGINTVGLSFLPLETLDQIRITIQDTTFEIPVKFTVQKYKFRRTELGIYMFENSDFQIAIFGESVYEKKDNTWSKVSQIPKD